MPKTRYFHPLHTMKGSQSTPALSAQLSPAPSRFPPVHNRDNNVAATNNSSTLQPSLNNTTKRERVNSSTKYSVMTSNRERDDQIIAEALAHATSYTELDTQRIQEAGFDPADFLELDQEQDQQDQQEYNPNNTDDQPSDTIGSATTRQRELKELVTYWVGEPPKAEEPEVREAQHRERVETLIANIKDKTSRRLQAPKWVKDKQNAVEAENLTAMGGMNTGNETEKIENLRRHRAKRLSDKDVTYPKWVKNRMDFQNVFHRFAFRPRDLTKVALIAAKKHPEERLPQDKEVLLQWVAQNYPLLTKDAMGDDECLELVINKIRTRNGSANEIIYKAGEDANVFYLVFKGSVRLDFPGDIGDLGHRVVHATEGFGEEALSVGALRPVVATALENGTILGTVRGFSFRETTTAYRQNQNLRSKRFLTEMVPLLAGWSTNRLLALAEMAERRRYLKGERIGQQGKPVPGLAFLVSGRATVHKEVAYTKTNRWPTSQNGDYKEVSRETSVMVDICELQVGEYFGEELLLGHEIWQGTIIADEPVEALFIPRGEQMFTMFRRVAAKTLSVNQREHMQSEEMIASKYLGQIQMNKTLERQKSLCYGIKHSIRLEEAGSAELSEVSSKKWQNRKKRYQKKVLKEETIEREKRDLEIAQYRAKRKIEKALSPSRKGMMPSRSAPVL